MEMAIPLHEHKKLQFGTPETCITFQVAKIHAVGNGDPTTRTQETTIWYPGDTCITFQVAKIHAARRIMKCYQNFFIDCITFDKRNPDQIRPNRQKDKNLEDIENKLTRFQIYPETEVGC